MKQLKFQKLIVLLMMICILSIGLVSCIPKTNKADNNGGEEPIPPTTPTEDIGTTTEPPVEASRAKAEELIALGLGYGVNALTADSATEISRAISMFDKKQLADVGVGQYKVGSNRATAITSQEISTVIQSYNASLIYGRSANANVLQGMFTAGFSTKFGLESNIGTAYKLNQFYYIQNQYVKGNNFILNDYGDDGLYASMLSQTLRNDLIKVKNNTMSVDALLEKYGTHVVMGVSFGGMIECAYSMLSTEDSLSTTVGAALSAQFSASISNGSSSAGGSQSSSAAFDAQYLKNNSDYKTHLDINTVGGTVISSATFGQLAGAYSEWVSSINNTDKHVIMDVADQGLVPIWYYFPEEYSSVASKVESRFNERAVTAGGILAEKMKKPTIIVAGGPYNATMTRKNCQQDNGYNYDVQASSVDMKNRHYGFELGQLVLNNTVKNSDGTYTVATGKLPSLFFNLTQDINSLPLYIANSATVNEISDDTWSGAVKDTNINGKKIGKGAYYVRITYTDSTQSEYNATNIFNNQARGSNITLLSGSNFNSAKTVKNITVVIVYEMASCAQGAFGIWWRDHTNWHLSYTYNFK
ncbi:MAG: hypothetical protein LBT20_06145 [Clostridiales bacterium]|jgi:hypothetical protein|nr:hypothetical protein [Clostridiales bacterium]